MRNRARVAGDRIVSEHASEQAHQLFHKYMCMAFLSACMDPPEKERAPDELKVREFPIFLHKTRVTVCCKLEQLPQPVLHQCPFELLR